MLALARALWKKPIHERRAAAVELLEQYKKELLPEDIDVVEDLSTRGARLGVSRQLGGFGRGRSDGALSRPARSGSRPLGERRRFLAATIRPARVAPALTPRRRRLSRFCRYADAMLEEKEFFIRKAIGWVLRETAKKTPQRVMDWLLPRAARASGLTVREASKHLPAADKNRILQAHAGNG